MPARLAALPGSDRPTRPGNQLRLPRLQLRRRPAGRPASGKQSPAARPPGTDRPGAGGAHRQWPACPRRDWPKAAPGPRTDLLPRSAPASTVRAIRDPDGSGAKPRMRFVTRRPPTRAAAPGAGHPGAARTRRDRPRHPHVRVGDAARRAERKPQLRARPGGGHDPDPTSWPPLTMASRGLQPRRYASRVMDLFNRLHGRRSTRRPADPTHACSRAARELPVMPLW
jgi:hypothetical protein